MRIVIVIFYCLLILVGVSFAVLNASAVSVNLYFTSLSMPLSLLMTVMLGLGMIVGFVLFTYKYWRLKIEQHKIKNQLKLTEKEIRNLRSIPVKDKH